MWRRKVLWSEGLFLRPQHFQQQERYVENLIDHRVRAIRPYGWGFETLGIDQQGIETGMFGLDAARGVLPDGTVFDLPGQDAPCSALKVPTDAADTVVYLAAISERQGIPVATLDEADRDSDTRYGCVVSELADQNGGFDEPAPVQLGELRLQLLLAQQVTGAHAAMPVARIIERKSDGRLVLDAGFIAPMLSVDEHPVLRGFVRELLGLLRQRADALAQRMLKPGRGGVAEIAEFLLLQVVNRYTALFDHLNGQPRLHPESLYLQCIAMAGELATFGDDRRLVNAFPDYDHDDLQLSFRPVMDALRLALSMVLEQGAISIELLDRKYGVRVAVIPDKSLLSSAEFVLAVNAQMPSETLRKRFGNQVKIGPVEKIRDLVNLQLPGVGLRAMPVAPRQIPYHAGFSYFELDRNHELWRMLDTSGGLAVHLAGEFPGLEMEFWAIRN